MSGKWREIFAAVNYARMLQRVHAALRTWQEYDHAYMIDDAMSDAIFSLLKEPPKHNYTEDDLVRMIVKRAANMLNKNYRRERRKTELQEDVATEDAFPQGLHENPEWEHDWDYIIGELCRRVHKLSLQAPCVILRGEWGYALEDIAVMFGATEQAVRKTLWRAQKNIEDILRESPPLPIEAKQRMTDFFMDALFAPDSPLRKMFLKRASHFWLFRGYSINALGLRKRI